MDLAALQSGIVKKLNALAEEQTKSGSWVYNRIEKQLYGSPGVYAIYDVEDKKSDLFISLQNIYKEQDFSRLTNIFKRRIEQNRSFTRTLSIRTAAGNLKEIKLTGKGEYKEDGSCELVYGTVQDVTFQQILRKNRDFQSTVLNSIGDTVIATDKVGRITFWNKSAEKKYLYTRKEVLGRNLSELRPDFSMELFLAENPERECLLQEQDIYFDKHGNGHPVLKKISKLYNDNNEFQGILIIASDISKEVELQSQLVERENILHKMFDKSSVPMLLIDMNGKPQQVNDAFLDLFGFERHTFFSWSYEVQKQYDHTDEDNVLTSKLLCGELDSYTVDKKTRRADGRDMWLNVTGNLIRNADGEPDICVKIYKDITREKLFSDTILALNEELQKNEEKIRTILSNSHDLIVILNKDGVFSDLFGGIELVTGYRREELLGRKPSDLNIPSYIYWKEFSNNVGGERVYNSELKRKDGRTIKTVVHAVNLLHNPFVRGVVGTIRDVSRDYEYTQQLKEAKQKAEEYSELQANFLANISHEVRTPLNGIIGTAELLADDLTEPDQLELVQIQLQSANRLLKTLNNILTISSGRQQGAFFSEPFDLVEACRQTLILHQHRAVSKGIHCELITDSNVEELTVLGSEVIFQQALGNLIDNSIKFTSSGHVHIRIFAEAGQAIIEVEDTGIGMSAEFAARAFEPFTQESSGLKRKFEGNGLGLAIVKKYINSMYGSISLSSEPGKGTKFTITLRQTPA